MAARGVHFALTAEDEQKLLACPADERANLIAEDIEPNYFEHSEQWLCQTDKAWDAIHRAFASSNLDYDYATPLHGVVLGGQPLYFKDDYLLSLKTASQVVEIASALSGITQDAFRQLYFGINPRAYVHPLSEEDLEYSWSNLEGLVPFYARAAEARRSVIFTADQ
jgi:hypothetical protein